MIKFEKDDNRLILSYSPSSGIKWIQEKLECDGVVLIKKVFCFSRNDVFSNASDLLENDWEIKFLIGYLQDDNYYYINSNLLDTKQFVMIHKDARIVPTYFGLNKRINIIKIFEEIANSQIIIGGEKENSIPIKDYEELIKKFPTDTEKKYYVKTRIANILSQYIDNVTDYGLLFEKYLKRKFKDSYVPNTIESVKSYEREKYSFILKQLREMLNNYDGYTEADWQNKILEFITIIYPKYLTAIPNLNIKDYTKNSPTDRYIDVTLLDENGQIDIIEIKKPSGEKGVLAKTTYRDNFIPSKELTGAVMQMEKYLFHLNRMGANGEKFLSEKYSDKLAPYNLQIKIVNPKGIIISGISSKFNSQQKLDFEIIRRKYANVIDIITYDDLINRLENLIQKFQ